MTEAELMLELEKLDDAARKRVLDWACDRYRPFAAPPVVTPPQFIPYPVPMPAPSVPWIQDPWPWPGRTITVVGGGLSNRTACAPNIYPPMVTVETVGTWQPVFGPGDWVPNGPPMAWS